MPLDNKCRIGPLAGAPPDTCAVVIITETESGFITEDDTSFVTRPRFQSALMMWGQSVLADVGSSSQLHDVVGAEVATLLIARSSRSFVFLGRPDPPRRYTLPSVIHFANTEQLPYRSDRGGGRYVFDQPASLRPIIRPPIKVRQLLVLPPVILEA
ncbi:hypothetical protein TNCV_579421 [Trichonephila clavipes]|nr:hypothetical protein TNCV_579421 [Trichonephila clavipes]